MGLTLESPRGEKRRTYLKSGDEITFHRPEHEPPYISLIRRSLDGANVELHWSNGGLKFLIGVVANNLIVRLISEVTGFSLRAVRRIDTCETYRFEKRKGKMIRRRTADAHA